MSCRLYSGVVVSGSLPVTFVAKGEPPSAVHPAYYLVIEGFFEHPFASWNFGTAHLFRINRIPALGRLVSGITHTRASPPVP
jgi:hypothetical protein